MFSNTSMKKFTGQVLLIGLVCVAALAVGCSKGSDSDATGDVAVGGEQAVSASSSTLPEAAEVMAALDKQDYEGVVAGLVRAKQNVSTPEQQTQFANLTDDVKIRLLEEAPTNPKATEALTVLRGITGGR